MKTAIFSDFDGTISLKDVGYSLFHHFSDGKNDALLPAWKSGEMSTRDCLLAEAEMVNATPEEIYAFIDTMSIDLAFPKFLTICQEKSIPLKILSDGLDVYIKHLLKKAGLANLDFKANKAKLINNTIEITFDHENKTCKRCGVCKGEVIRDFREKKNEPYQIIFIGDGYSDICAAKETDLLFAKKDLEEYCQKEKIQYISYDNFDDIISVLQQRDII